MKALFIGGTGTISKPISQLSIARGWELYLLNRGNREVPEGARLMQADIRDEDAVREKLSGLRFDVVADFIAFTPEQVERDYRLFSPKTGQYIFISSASAYHKPLASPFITESTPLHNPYWQYSRDKIACEQLLTDLYRKEGFPVTIVRPSHTYGEQSVPVALHGSKGFYQVIDRMKKGKKVIVPGDGTSLWTLTWSADFAWAFAGLMGNLHAIGETYQITSDESLTWNQIYQAIASALGVEAKLVHIPSDVLGALNPEWVGNLTGDKANSVVFDNSKIKRAVPDYVATARFDEGVRVALKYIESHPEHQVPDPEFDAWCDRMIEAWERAVETLPRYGQETK
jgi:nucleoside-diphosphate-sugar epimerase